MWLMCLNGLILLSGIVTTRDVYENTGYFWHITDIHYGGHFSTNADYKRGCWRSEYDGNSGSRFIEKQTNAVHYGGYNCDSTWTLIESAAKAMMSYQNDNVEFVLWTGDALSHTARRLPDTYQLELLQNLTDLLTKTFRSQFVFPSLGHDDPSSRKELGKMWRRWLPTDSMHTFEAGGYYIIERKMLKLQIVVLNTNLMRKPDDDPESQKQWDWLNTVLHKFHRNGETVYIVGHAPPGSAFKQRGILPNAHSTYTDHHNRKYIKLVRKYAGIIVGQFFGHLHSDTFRIIYSETGRPISWAMISPAMTPRRTLDGLHNPGLRLYKFDKNSGEILDYTQYYLDLSTSSSLHSKNEPRWIVEYNFSSYYGLSDITPRSLHQLAHKLTSGTSNDYFTRYYQANFVRASPDGQINSCDEYCAHVYHCAITRVDYQEYDLCTKSKSDALSSIAPLWATSGTASVIFFVTLLIQLLN